MAMAHHLSRRPLPSCILLLPGVALNINIIVQLAWDLLQLALTVILSEIRHPTQDLRLNLHNLPQLLQKALTHRLHEIMLETIAVTQSHRLHQFHPGVKAPAHWRVPPADQEVHPRGRLAQAALSSLPTDRRCRRLNEN